MGAYLSEPNVDSHSEEKTVSNLTYGVSAMQGWRVSMEDAHNCVPDLDDNTSLFAVYDGHGGAEVAQYLALHYPDILKSLSEYKQGKIADALIKSFTATDERLTEPDVIQQLQQLSGVDSAEETCDDEAEMLIEDKNIPIEDILVKYGYNPLQNHNVKKLKKDQGCSFQSPVIRKTKAMIFEKDKKTTTTAESDGLSKEINAEQKTDNSEQKTDNSELKTESSEQKTDNSELKTESSEQKTDNSEQKTDNSEQKTDNSEQSSNKKTVAETDSTEPEQSNPVSADLKPSSDTEKQDGGIGTETANGCDDETHRKGKSKGKGKGKGKAVKKTLKQNGNTDEDDSDAEIDSDEEDTDDDEDDSSEEEEDDFETHEEADDSDEEDEDVIVPGDREEPGSDSGSTAVVCVLRCGELYVANAGDSRCVVSRSGKAIEMSVDHKPEDEAEIRRITKAGGKVTKDGRVNGGLNLSRAIGDHFYKRNKELSLSDQMISSMPDIRTLTICDEDEFMILACDGIWNVLTSQEVVDIVRNGLGNKDLAITDIINELFEMCLAPDTSGDGTGCDNMTCIIVTFKPRLIPKTAVDESGTVKSDNSGTTVEKSSKITDDIDEKKQSQSSSQARVSMKRPSDEFKQSDAKKIKTDTLQDDI